MLPSFIALFPLLTLLIVAPVKAQGGQTWSDRPTVDIYSLIHNFPIAIRLPCVLRMLLVAVRSSLCLGDTLNLIIFRRLWFLRV